MAMKNKKYIILQKNKPAKWEEKQKDVHKISIDDELHISEIKFPKTGKYYLILNVDKEFKTELKENQNEVELLIKKP